MLAFLLKGFRYVNISGLSILLSIRFLNFICSVLLPEVPRKTGRAAGKTLADIVDESERQALEAALRASDGSRERAAEALDISPTTLWRKMTRLGITFENR